ncbi:MAG: hypothetical protein KCHDKBKB_01357 [Elusimicrobia bacterium]|nr:hypothetical protein [Elusimicrobiota bacterium]
MKKLIAVLALILGACAPSPLKTIVIFGDTLSFVPDPHDQDVLIHRNSRFVTTNYSKFIIDPVTLFSDQYAGNRGIKPEELAMLANEFRNELINTLKDGYEIVDSSGAEVLRIRTAIRDIHPAHWELDEDEFVLLKFDTTLESAVMEIDCLDSRTGERVVALVHPLKGRPYMEQENLSRLRNIQDAFRIWAKSLRKRFDEEKMKSNSRP